MPAANDRSPVDLTVVVATRNRAALLPACLDALAAQRTDARFEVLVVDNGSDDGTAGVVARHARRDPRVRLVAEPVAGLSRAKNAGIAHAVGELVLFTDDDVVLPEGWIAAYAGFFAGRRARAVLAGGPVLAVADDLSPWPAWVGAGGAADLPRLYHGAVPRRLGAYEQLWGANMAAPRELLAAVGGFDESIGVRGDERGTFEDVDLVERVAARGGECWYLPAAVLYHRTARAASSPRALARRAFARGANDVLRARRGSHYERALPVPRRPLPAAVCAPLLLAGWMLGALALRAMPRRRRAVALVRRAAWGAGWCTAAATASHSPRVQARSRLAAAGRRLALRITPP